MKTKNKWISFIFAIAILLTFLIPPTLNAISADSVNESYVSAITIKEIITGLAPFDNDNNPGNDNGPANNIVRSFDNINYTLEYITELKTNNPITDAYLCIEFILPYPKEIATFDMTTMAWMEDYILTESEGKQILTGKRYLQNNSEGNAIPGEGTLSVGIKVQAAPNGTKIKPEFKLYMEGNNASEAKSIISEEITVSAAPKYDLELKKQGYTDYLGYYDIDNGVHSKEKIDNGKFGRMQAYSLGLKLYNDNTSKGMKGIELPQGTIEFDLTLDEYKSAGNSGILTQQEGYTPYLWDYKENEYHRNGNLGRTMLWGGESNTGQSTCAAPLNTGNTAQACYNGGSWTITKIDGTINKYHVIINNYSFSPDMVFPTRYCSDSSSTVRHGDNVGWFSAGFINVLCQFPEGVTDVTNVYLSVKADNFKSTSISGQTGIDVLNNNDYVSPITLYPPGSMSKNIQFNEKNYGKALALNWSERGDSSRLRQQLFCVLEQITIKSDYPMKSMDLLTKFDDEAFEVPANTSDRYTLVRHCYASGTTGTYKLLYAAKPDKTGWNSDAEMIATTQEQLVYFTSIEELNNQGYTCVAYLYECRNWIAPVGIECVLNLQVKANAKTNNTYQVVSNAREWEYDIGNVSMTDFTYNNGYALNSEGYVQGYPTPSKYCYTPYYTKTEYNTNGTIVTGTHAGGFVYGNTILIKEYNATISKKVTDLDKSGKLKTSYDMDANERTVNYEIWAEAKSEIQGGTTNLYITDTLPKDLTYNQGSSFWNNESFEPAVTINSNGTTTLYWELRDVPVGQTLNPIKFNCTIGKAGTNQDVQNNQIITNTVKINADGDMRENLLRNGNVAEANITVIKLNAISISKSTSTPYISLGQNFDFILKYANNSENALPDSKIYDILPYKGDARGSNFEGFYKINSITINFTNAPKTFTDFINNNYSVDYTTTTNIPTNSFNDIIATIDWIEITTKTIDSENKTVTYTGIPENTTGLVFNMQLAGLEYVEILLNISPTGAQEEGDIYINGFYQYSNGQIEQVHSNHVAVQVYGHLDVTKIWQDDNNKYDTRPSSLDIQIFQNGNEYKNITLTPNNAVVNTLYKWYQRIDNVPLYDLQGNPYTYTIEEDITDINSNFYFDAIYDQKNLTVTNIGIWVKNNNYPEYMIIVNKDIINKNNQMATVDDFNKIKLNNNQEFQIVLKQLNRTIINNGTTLSESYNGYSGNEYHGIVTDANQLIFRNIPAGKYEISENIIQYFDFIGIEKIENSEHATFTVENGKYYITLSGLHENNEHVEVKVTNKIKDFRPYDKSPSQDNLFKGPSQ